MNRHQSLVSAAILGIAVGVVACTPSSEGSTHTLSLSDVGAEKLGGLGGKALGSQCVELPMPANAVGRDCHHPPSSLDETGINFSAGKYAVVLLCEDAGQVTYELKEGSHAPAPVTIKCGADGTSVAQLFSIDKAGHIFLDEKFEGIGYAVSTIVKMP